MATRRRSSGGAPRSRPGAAARATRSREARDGKKTVPCPACGTEYRIPLELLDEQLSCKSCGRAFVPSSSSTRRIRNRNPAQPFILGGALLVFMIVGFVLISSRGPSTDNTDDKPRERQVETGARNPRVRDVQDWQGALASGNTFKLAATSEISALAKVLGVAQEPGNQGERERIVLETLLSDPRTAVMRDAYTTSGSISKDEAEAAAGTVRLDLAIKDEATAKWSQPVATYDVSFEFREGRARVTGWEVIYEPPPKQPKAPRGPRYKPHDLIGEAQNVEREYDGKTEVVREAELKALPHLEGTPPEVQQQIDDAIAVIIDLDGPGGAANRANLALRRVGKPAVPRLLNKLYELVVGQADALTDQTTVLRIRRVAGALEDLTGQRFGFNPSILGDAKSATPEYRLSSLKQWYGYWADNYWSDTWQVGVDQGEALLGETPDPNDRKNR